MKLSTFLLTALLISISIGAAAEESRSKLENTESIFDQEFVLENIYCVGNTKTKCSLIKKELRVRSGKKVRDKDLQNSKIRLQLLGLFDEVDLNLKKGSERGKVDLEVSVKEGSSIYTVLDIGLGHINRRVYDSRSEFRNDLQLTLGTRNLLGLGKRLSATVYSQDGGGLTGNNGEGSYRLRYTDPNLLGSKRFFYNFDYVYGRDLYKQKNPVDLLNYTQQYLGEGHLAQLEFGLRVGSFSYFTVGYSAVFNKESYDYVEDGNLKSLKKSGNQKFVIAGFGVNTQDDLYFPTSGTRLDIKLPFEVGSSNSSSYFVNGGLSSEKASSVIFAGELDWKTTWQLAPKFYLTGFAESRSHLENDDLVNSGLGLKFSYQTRRNQTYKDISDLRFFVTPSITNSVFDDYGPQLAAGVKLRSKKYGLARFQLFLRDGR